MIRRQPVVVERASLAHFQLRQLLPDKSSGDKQRYFRFDTRLDLALDDMDVANSANIAALKAEAAQILRDQAAEFERLPPLLT